MSELEDKDHGYRCNTFNGPFGLEKAHVFGHSVVSNVAIQKVDEVLGTLLGANLDAKVKSMDSHRRGLIAHRDGLDTMLVKPLVLTIVSVAMYGLCDSMCLCVLLCVYEIVREICEVFVDLKLAIRQDLGFIPSGNVVLSSTYVGKILGADQLLVILCYRYQESGIGYWILSMTISGSGVTILWAITGEVELNGSNLVQETTNKIVVIQERLEAAKLLKELTWTMIDSLAKASGDFIVLVCKMSLHYWADNDAYVESKDVEAGLCGSARLGIYPSGNVVLSSTYVGKILEPDHSCGYCCYRYQESGIGYWILSMTISGSGVTFLPSCCNGSGVTFLPSELNGAKIERSG
ncbi:hypothetical protein Tco_1456558 [Tanacetum coccineum]